MRSHIIPKFHWKPLKKTDGFFHLLSSNPKKREVPSQKELTEYLLCRKCDGEVIQKYEDYLARVIFGGTEIETLDRGNNILVKGLNYQKLKNALLSILWRMDLANHSFFSDVTISEEHSERIRKILLHNEKVPESDYPVNLCIPIMNGVFEGSWTLQPDSIERNGSRVFRCLISGLVFTFLVGPDSTKYDFEEINLKEDGSWILLKADVLKIPFLKSACGRIYKAHVERNKKA